MLLTNQKLYNTLKEMSIIPSKKLEELFKESEDKKSDLSLLLLKHDLISDENLGRLIADMLSIRYIRLSSVSIDQSTLQIIPEPVAKKQRILAFKQDKDGLHLAMANPKDTELISFVAKKLGVTVIPYYANESDLDSALTLYQKDAKTSFQDLVSQTKAHGKASGSETSIIKLVDMIITYGYQNKVSDIHIEPFEEKSLVRYRIDGILHDISELPKVLHDQLVTRIKIMSNLRTDEHKAAQDGKISYKLEDEALDIRISIVPITNGEKVVMRILSEKSRHFSLVDLGFSESDLRKVEHAYKRPHGMILSTGPTGSGKTTTLYAVLKLLNTRDVNIMTIEDPVEYEIEGINQIQVNEKTDLTFATGLRSIVRQDPDVILVGEIRDEETADISINAAMTGHLVLSTLHTNDAATSIPRLLEMNVEPFLVASTVNVIIAQRLVRKICEHCRVSYELLELKKKLTQESEEESDMSETQYLLSLVNKYLGNDDHTRVYLGKGCNICHGTGYQGRVGIFEVLVVDEAVRTAVTEMKDASVIKGIAVKNGMKPMIEDGIEKVKLGITTMEEILRVTKE